MEKEIHEIEKIKWGAMNVSVYRNTIISKLIGGYSLFGKKVKTPQEVDEIINKHELIKQPAIPLKNIDWYKKNKPEVFEQLNNSIINKK